MAGTITELAVATKLAVRAMGRRLRGEIEAGPDRSEFRHRFRALIDKVSDGIITDTRWRESSGFG